MARSLFHSLFAMLLVLSCSKPLTFQKTVHNGIEMLYGKITIEQLYFDYPEWKLIENSYAPDAETISKIGETGQKITVMTFLGTWCGDSEMHVPACIKILKSVPDPSLFDLELWAVDRKKNLDNNLTANFKIERVPTFIFLRKGSEIGRIVESPQQSLEKDMLQILTGIE